MKGIIISFLLLIVYTSFGQSPGNDSTRYIHQKFVYGSRQPRFWADSVLQTPQDTTFSKNGLAIKGNKLFVGNGVYWTQSGSGSVIAPSSGIDSITWQNTTICFYLTNENPVCFPFDRFICYRQDNFDGTKSIGYNCNDEAVDSISNHVKYLKQGPGIQIDSSGPYKDTIILSATGGATGGISKLGSPPYGLTRINDSTYIADSSVLTSQPRTTAGLALKLNSSDTTNKWVQSAGLSTSGDSLVIIKNAVRTATKITMPAGGGGGIDSLRKRVGTDSILQYTSGTGTLAVRTQRVFNVLDYGAVRNDTTINSTSAFAACMADLVAKGGGVFYVPAGIYKGKIRIPKILAPNFMPITIRGEYSPTHFFGPLGAFSLPNHGSIIYSRDTAYPYAVIQADSSAGVFGSFSQTTVTIENLEVRTYDNSKINGIDFSFAGQLVVDNVFINTGVYSDSCSNPTNGASGLITPKVQNYALTLIKNLTVSGYYNGLVANEHTNALSLQIQSNYNGIYFAGGHAMNITRAIMQDNHNNIYVNAGDPAVFEFNVMGIEHMDSTTQSTARNKWQITQYDLKDTANKALADINYYVTSPGLGLSPNFLKTGGTNVNLRKIGNVPAAISQPLNQFVYGSGTGFNSTPNYTFDSATSTTSLRGTTAAMHLLNVTSGTANANLRFQRNSVNKWNIVNGFAGGGTTNDFAIYNYNINKAPFYLTEYGSIGLGNTATASYFNVFSNGGVSVNTSTIALRQNFVVNGTANVTTSLKTPSIISTSDLTITPGSNRLLFGANSVMNTAAAANNVLGIGTTSPTSLAGYAGITINGTSGNGSLIDFNVAAAQVGRVLGEPGKLTFRNYSTTSFIIEMAAAGGAGTRWLTIPSTGNLGIGTITSPTSYIHLPAGTATAGTSPIGFTAGTVLTTPLSGKLETNATNNLFYTNSSAVRAQVGMWAYIAKTSTYTATDGDYTIDCTSGTFTVTLPTAVGIQGRVYVIKNSGAGVITMAGTSAQPFDGVTSPTIAAGAVAQYQSNNVAWIKIN